MRVAKKIISIRNSPKNPRPEIKELKYLQGLSNTDQQLSRTKKRKLSLTALVTVTSGRVLPVERHSQKSKERGQIVGRFGLTLRHFEMKRWVM